MRSGIGLEGDAAGDGGKGSHSGLAQLGRHARWLRRGVDLERQGLVVKVQGMGVGANAGVGMLGRFVVVPGGFGVGVVGHGWVRSSLFQSKDEPEGEGKRVAEESSFRDWILEKV